MNVFLTGGTGFIGQPLTRSLLRRGWNVTALVRKPDSPQALALSEMGARLAAGDITNCETMRSPMSGADMVVHNAGHYEVGLDRAGKERMHRVNIDGTENVLGQAYELSIPRTIYVSTVQAFGDSGDQLRDETYVRQFPCRTTYEQTKTESHEIALQYMQRGLPLIIVCPNGVIGPNDHSFAGYILRLYINRALPPMGWSPNTWHAPVGLDDLVEGITLAAVKGRAGETYFLSGEPISLREFFNIWSRKPGGYLPRVWLPAGLASALLAPLEPLERMMGLPAFFSREAVKTSSTNWYYSNEKAKRELDWTPCSAEAIWFTALDGEIELLRRRKGQNLIQRLKPLDTVY
jgi:nucleoside-diphosphate-sugar epimerase